MNHVSEIHNIIIVAQSCSYFKIKSEKSLYLTSCSSERLPMSLLGLSGTVSAVLCSQNISGVAKNINYKCRKLNVQWGNIFTFHIYTQFKIDLYWPLNYLVCIFHRYPMALLLTKVRTYASSDLENWKQIMNRVWVQSQIFVFWLVWRKSKGD